MTARTLALQGRALLGKVSGHWGAGAHQVDRTTSLWGNKNWSIRRCKQFTSMPLLNSPYPKPDLN